MAIKAMVFIVVAAATGAVVGIAHSDNEVGQQFRQQVEHVLSPAVDAAVNVSDQIFFAPKFETGRPDTILASFALDGKSEPTFATCMQSVGASSIEGLEALATRHEHRMTTSLVNCLMTHNRHRFCDPSQRQQIATAMELYLWSRDYNFNNRALLDERYQLARANDPDLNPGAFDAYYKTWDGPEDQAVYDNLKSLARNGYLNPDAFGMLPRYEIRQAMDGMKSEFDACPSPKSEASG